MRHNDGPGSVRPHANARAEELLQQLAKRRRANTRATALPGLDALDTYLIVTHANLMAREQAVALGVCRSTVTYWRNLLYRRKLLRREERARNAPITRSEVEAVARLYEQGYTAGRIAEARQVAVNRVFDVLARAGTSHSNRPALLRTRQLAALLGVNVHVPRRLVAYGWLIDARVGPEKSGAYGWTRADVFDLLRRREAWLAFSPGSIRDPELAAFLRREQAAAGGRWHTRGELAALIGIGAATASQWATNGVFDGLPAAAWGSLDCLWLTDQQAHDLEVAAAPVRAVAGQGWLIVRRAMTRALPTIRAALETRPEAYQAAAD